MPMQPSPSAETSRSLFPSLRFCMAFSIRCQADKFFASKGGLSCLLQPFERGGGVRGSCFHQCRYCSSLTFSSHSTFLPSRIFVMAIWLIELEDVAPCQCLTPGGVQIT